MLQGLTPFHVFFVEYPPGAVPLFTIPALVWDEHYVTVFKLMMAACGVGFVLCSAWMLRRLELSAWRLVPVVLAPVLMGPVFLNRYDPLAALLACSRSSSACAATSARRSALLGAGAALKLYAGRLRADRGAPGALAQGRRPRRS